MHLAPILVAALAAPAALAAQIVFLEPRESPSAGFADLRAACEGRLDVPGRRLGWTRLALPSHDMAAAGRALAASAAPTLYVTAHTTLAQAAAAVRPATPLVIVTLANPADLGLGEADARRTANVTGFTYFYPFELKHFELIRELAPEARTIGIVSDEHWSREALARRILGDSRALVGADVRHFLLTRAGDLARLEGADAAGVDAWFVPDTPSNRTFGREIAMRLARWKRPTMGGHHSHLDGGGLATYEPERVDHWARLCGMVRMVLSGIPAREIAFDRPKRFRLRVSTGAAARMGVRVPEAMLKRADQVLP